MVKSPKVSIIMPSLNVARYILPCIESVLTQTLTDIEIICIDAGSTDGTAEIIKGYAAADHRIRYLKSTRKSYGYQVNMGIALASGDYVGIVETDDYVVADMFQTLYETALEHHVDIAKSDSLLFFENSHKKRFSEKCFYFWQNPLLYNRVLNPAKHLLLHSIDTNIWSGIYRRDFLLTNNIRLNESPGAAYQDIGFLQQSLCAANSVIYLDKILYCYRRTRPGSSSCDSRRLQFVYQEYDYLFGGSILNKPSYETHYTAILKRFAEAFCNETYGTILDLGISEELPPMYKKMQNIIDTKLKEGLLHYDDFSDDYKKKLRLALYDIPQFCSDIYQREDNATQHIKKIMNYVGTFEPCIMFGFGNRCQKLIDDLIKYDVNVVAICDNNHELWKKNYREIPIISPSRGFFLHREAKWVITNKRNTFAITEQLHTIGVENILMLFEPENSIGI